MIQTYDLQDLAAAVDERKKYSFIETAFPSHGPYRQELYAKHMEFFSHGEFSIRLFMAGNQIGKTRYGGLYEIACHVMGWYPWFWDKIGGTRYAGANDWWIAGETSKDVRNIIQRTLLGKVGEFGTGLIKKENLIFESLKDAKKDGTFVEQFSVKHSSGGRSLITLKSYEQGRESFQGEPVNVLLDEQPPEDIMTECVTRQTTSSADRPLKMMMTYTPLKGMSGAMKTIFPRNKVEFGDLGNGVYVVNASMMDVPHIDNATRERLLSFYPKHQRQARMLGIPTVTEGAIYGLPEEDDAETGQAGIVCNDFPIPDYWPRVGGMDVGWNKTAAAYLAHDRDNGVWYLYKTHYKGKQLPSEHADDMRGLDNGNGEWIPICIDPASRGRSQRDGEVLMDNYRDLGLNVTSATNAVEAGIDQVLGLLSSGRLLVFRSCKEWLDEYRNYSRDKDGKVIKVGDHLMDATRYSICTHGEKRTGRDLALTKAEYLSRKQPTVFKVDEDNIPSGDDSWLIA